jgi:hypothetical protein
MTIEEAKREKKQLEAALTQALIRFSSITGLCVSGVNLEYSQSIDECGEAVATGYKAKLCIDL